jgi:hypothetical protein
VAVGSAKKNEKNNTLKEAYLPLLVQWISLPVRAKTDTVAASLSEDFEQM